MFAGGCQQPLHPTKTKGNIPVLYTAIRVLSDVSAKKKSYAQERRGKKVLL